MESVPLSLSMASPDLAEGEADVASAVSKPSFPSLYDAHVQMVWRTLRRLGVAESSIEDAVQEVFVVAHRKLETFEGRSSVSTWLYGIAVFVSRNVRRHARRHPEAALPEGHEEPGPGAAQPDVLLADREAARIVERLVDELAEDKREVFVLAELEQLSGPEIAASLGVNLNTVYARLRAARQEFEAAAVRERARQDSFRRRT